MCDAKITHFHLEQFSYRYFAANAADRSTLSSICPNTKDLPEVFQKTDIFAIQIFGLYLAYIDPLEIYKNVQLSLSLSLNPSLSHPLTFATKKTVKYEVAHMSGKLGSWT